MVFLDDLSFMCQVYILVPLHSLCHKLPGHASVSSFTVSICIVHSHTLALVFCQKLFGLWLAMEATCLQLYIGHGSLSLAATVR